MKIVYEMETPYENNGSEPKDHSNTTCFLCHDKETVKKPNGRPYWRKYKTDENGNFNIKGTNWDGKSYICQVCYNNNVWKLVSKWRNKQLPRDSTQGK